MTVNFSALNIQLTIEKVSFAQREHNWSFKYNKARLLPSTGKIDRNSVMVEVHINDFRSADVGRFCCGANYTDLEDVGRVTYTCDKLSGKIKTMKIKTRKILYILCLIDVLNRGTKLPTKRCIG